MASTVSSSAIASTHRFFKNIGISENLPEPSTRPDACSDIFRSILKLDRVESGRVVCTLTVRPPVANYFRSLHGGAVALAAEMVATACVKTVVEKELFLGELANSYVSAAKINDELEVVGLVVRKGRNVAVTSVEFRNKETKKLVYSSRATFYNLPVATL